MLYLSFFHLDFQVKIDVSVKFQTAPKMAPKKLDINQLDEKEKNVRSYSDIGKRA